jgi:methyl-accepting chemotaxis protein
MPRNAGAYMKFIATLSIRDRLIAAMLFAVIVSTSVVAWVGHSSAKQLLSTRLEQSEMPNLVQRVRNAVDGEINQMKVVTQSIASNSLAHWWIEEGESAQGEQKLVEYLGELAKANGFSNASFAWKPSNKYWNQDGFLRELKPDRDGWFFAFKNSGNAESSSIYHESSGEVNIFVNYQELNGNGLAGVSKPFNEMVNYLNSFRIEETGFVYLVDGQGNVKVHNAIDHTQATTLGDLYPSINSSSLLGERDFSFAVANDQVIASSFIPSLGWYVIAQVPQHELYAGLDTSRNNILMSFVVIAAIFVVLSFVLGNSLVKPLVSMAQTFEQLGQGEGDLTQRIDAHGSEEMKRLANGFNGFIEKIHTVVSDVANTSRDVNGASQKVFEDAQNSKVSADSQRDGAHQVSVAINEMGSTISEIATSASVAAQATNDATEKAKSAQGVVTESNTTIKEMASNMESVSSNIDTLAAKSDSISSVLDVIRGISEQTNLLALNAAIEAARAGEQGRGFAVVADEVRNLAQRTSESTDEIHAMITELQDGAKAAVSSVHEGREHAEMGVEASLRTNQVLEEIVGNVQHIADLNTQIATATEEQSAVISEINQHVVNIGDSSEHSAEASASIEASSESLKLMAQDLDKLVSRFKLS